MVRILPQIVAAARSLIKNDSSRRAGAKSLGVSYSGLSRALKLKRRKKKSTRGRQLSLTPLQIKSVKKLRNKIKKQGWNPTAKFCTTKLKLKNRFTKRKVSARTVQRILGTDDHAYCPMPTKSKVTPEKALCRLKWAKRMKRQKYKYKNVHVWIDNHTSEMPVVEKPRSPPGGKQWRKKSERNKNWALRSVPGFKAPSVKVCGGISPVAGGKLLFLQEFKRFNAQTAVKIFEIRLLPALKKAFPRKKKFLIQIDGDGAFTSFQFLEFCKENGLEIYPHPSRSPDIAPIENVWNEAERRCSEAAFESRFWRKGALRNQKNLDKWAVLLKKQIRATAASKNFVMKLINSMPDRIDKVIDLKGWKIPKR